MNGLSCLLPRKSKDGKLYLGEGFFWRLVIWAYSTSNFRIGPKPLTRKLVLAASPPTPDTQNLAVLHQNPPRHSYPAERFKHRFTPYGSSTLTPAPPATADSASAMEVDQEGDISPTTQKPKKRSRPTDGPKRTTKKSKAGKSQL